MAEHVRTTLDHAMRDLPVSGDAMRWTPDADRIAQADASRRAAAERDLLARLNLRPRVADPEPASVRPVAPGCGHELCGADGGACPGCGADVYEAHGVEPPATTPARTERGREAIRRLAQVMRDRE